MNLKSIKENFKLAICHTGTYIQWDKIKCLFGAHRWLYNGLPMERKCMKCKKQQHKELGAGLHDPDRWVTNK